ncbi:MAG: NAD-dependent epimerase/dehydratase [Limnobacter sp.]|uniref:NAD-dependent epimerase/dehydratase n=1 Tax=Limnobacter sp. TaxID=2003368 RepID=UPI003002F91C
MFITGALGFIGKHLARTLLNSKHAVFGLHRQKQKNTSMLNLEQLGMQWVGANEINDLFAKVKIDCVVHLATHYGRNGETKEVHESNITMPLFILNKFLEQNGRLFLNTDSYYTKGGRSYPAMQAYSETKNLFRILAHDLTKDTDCKFITARLEHVYGPDDNEQKLIPFLIRQFADNIEKIDLSSCEQSRDFIFVDDVCKAMGLILSNHSCLSPKYVELEIGTGQAVPLKNLIEYLATKIGTHTKRNYGAVNPRNGEISSSYADLQWTSSIDWAPTVKMNEGIDRTIHSYLKHGHQ